VRIVVRAVNPRLAREAQAQLDRVNVHALALAGAYRPSPDGEDITIIPSGDPDPCALARAALDSPAAPLICLAGHSAVSPPPPSGPASPFAGAIALDAQVHLLAAQIEAWKRIAVSQDERARRRSTATATGAPMPTPLAKRPLTSLYVGPPSAAFLALDHVFSAMSGSIAATFTSFSGFDHLHDQPFDAVILNAAQDAAKALSFCAALRRNSSLYHAPTMVVTSPGDAATATSALERGACATTETNALCTKALAWLFEAIRRERLRREAEYDMRAYRDLMGDTRTGLWLPGPFNAHLGRLASDHHASGRALALCAFRVLPAHGARAPSVDAWNRGFNEIASLAARLMRDADSGAVCGADAIAIALPASDLAGAKRTAERIAAVAECTAFAANEDGAGPLVFEQSAVELQAGESGPGLLARALRALELDAIQA
jgi:two-component system cell cycle response regulator PopA